MNNVVTGFIAGVGITLYSHIYWNRKKIYNNIKHINFAIKWYEIKKNKNKKDLLMWMRYEWYIKLYNKSLLIEKKFLQLYWYEIIIPTPVFYDSDIDYKVFKILNK